MSKLWVQSLALTTAIAGFSLPSSSVLIEGAMIAQNYDSNIQISQNLQRPILDIWQPPPPRDSQPVRGDGFCPLWPPEPNIIPDTRVIWNTRPIFVWVGKVKSIKITRKRADGKRIEILALEPVEGQSINPEKETSPSIFLYPTDAESLKPGRKYSFSVTYLKKINTPEGEREVEDSLDASIPFEVVGNPKYQQIDTDLNNLQAQNPNLNREELARKRIEYFAQKGLNADVLQEAFYLSNPSENWERDLEELGAIVFRRCQKENEAQSNLK